MNIVMTQAGIYELYCKMINFPIYKSQHEGDVSQFMLYCEETFFEQKMERVCVHFVGAFSRDLINKPKMWQFTSKDMEPIEGVDIVSMVDNLFTGLLTASIRKLMKEAYGHMCADGQPDSGPKEFRRMRRAVLFHAMDNWRCQFSIRHIKKAHKDITRPGYLQRVAVYYVNNTVHIELNSAGHELLRSLPMHAQQWLAPLAKPVISDDPADDETYALEP